MTDVIVQNCIIISYLSVALIALLLTKLACQKIVCRGKVYLLSIAVAMTGVQHCLPAATKLGPGQPVAQEHHLHRVLKTHQNVKIMFQTYNHLYLPSLSSLVISQIVHIDLV